MSGAALAHPAAIVRRARSSLHYESCADCWASALAARRARASAAMSSASVKGFPRCASMPAARRRCCSSSPTCAVAPRMGMWLAWSRASRARTRRASSRPSSPGISMSVSRMSNDLRLDELPRAQSVPGHRGLVPEAAEHRDEHFLVDQIVLDTRGRGARAPRAALRRLRHRPRSRVGARSRPVLDGAVRRRREQLDDERRTLARARSRTRTLPPILCARSRTIARPSPAPPSTFASDADTCANGSKIGLELVRRDPVPGVRHVEDEPRLSSPGACVEPHLDAPLLA